ncbi:unnamed protein product [Gulo gulo]|nr:unnamed protein product [Gulo gulo]
MTDSAF